MCCATRSRGEDSEFSTSSTAKSNKFLIEGGASGRLKKEMQMKSATDEISFRQWTQMRAVKDKDDRREMLWKVFNDMNEDNDGYISLDEFSKFFRAMKGLTADEITDEALKEVFEFYDAKGDGQIDFDEFLDPEGVRKSEQKRIERSKKRGGGKRK